MPIFEALTSYYMSDYLRLSIVCLTTFVKKFVAWTLIALIPKARASFGAMKARINLGMSKTLAYFGSLNFDFRMFSSAKP